MRRFALSLIAALALASPAFAIGDTPLQPLPGTAQYNLSFSGSQTLTVPNIASMLVTNVCVDGSNAVRYTSDGTAASATVGISLAVGQCALFYGGAVAGALKFYPVSGTATINVEYYK